MTRSLQSSGRRGHNGDRSANPLKTAFLYHPIFLKHETGIGHPESPRRLEAILKGLKDSALLKKCLRPEPVEAPLEAIERLHTREYIQHIEALSRQGGHFYEGPDTSGSSATFRSALMAAGAVVKATDCVMNGEAANAFCAVRPPGHHAERAEAMGFCFFNNVAIGARHLQDRHGIGRVAIIDWDVHHGNGTQHAFYDDPSVFYFSIHQWPHYPGTGRRDETGSKDGMGSTMNSPIGSGATDTDFLTAFKEMLRPAMNRFKPEFILVSAGFDAHVDDPLSGTMVTTKGFTAMTQEVMALAEEHCKGRLVSVLEGGYNLDSLASCVVAHVRELMGGIE